MNILGFVSMFLIILAFLASSFQGKIITFRHIHRSHTHYLNASRNAQNNFERKQYQLIKKKKKPKEEKKIQEADKKPTPGKKHENMPECARLNLWPLFNDDTSDLKLIFENLIHTLYSTDFFPKRKTEDLFFERVITSAKNQLKEKPDSSLHLGKVHLNDPLLQSIYYAMLKGTKGLPSLLDYVKVEKMKHEICLACADELMLSSLFGPKVARRLMKEKEEEDDRLSITKEKLETLLNEEQITIDPNIWNHILFKHPRKKKSQVTITGKDDEVIVKRSVTLSHS